MKVISNGWNPSIVDGIISSRKSVFSEHFIWWHISNAINSDKILKGIIGLQELVIWNVGKDSFGWFYVFDEHEPLVDNELIDFFHVIMLKLLIFIFFIIFILGIFNQVNQIIFIQIIEHFYPLFKSKFIFCINIINLTPFIPRIDPLLAPSPFLNIRFSKKTAIWLLRSTSEQ